MTVNHTRAEVCKQEAGAREEDEVEREGTQSVVQKDMLKSEEEEGLKAKERRKGNVRLGHNTCLHLRGSKVQLVKSFHSLHSPRLLCLRLTVSTGKAKKYQRFR